MESKSGTWKSAATTDIGTVRKINEDDFLDAPNVGMWCVADGMGGHERGDVASKMIVDYLNCLNSPDFFPLGAEQIKERLIAVNERLVDMALSATTPSVIGSTVAVLIFDQQNAHCIWAGDSRVYRLRNNKFEQLTRDHSQVEEMVEAGLISAEEAESHPSANVITRAVGASETLELDVKSYPLEPNDLFLLCSDGLNKVVADGEIAEYLRDIPLAQVSQSLIETSLERQARDNVTVIVVQTPSVASITPSAVNASPDLDDTLPLDYTLPLRR